MPKGIYIRTTSPWNKGKKGVQKYSDETRENMKNNNIGINNPFYGKHHTEETKKILRIFNSGINGFNFGKSKSEETKLKMSLSQKGIVHPTGKNSYHWKGGITKLSFKIRNSDEYNSWRLSVFERDSYTCKDCGQIGGELNAHHIKKFAAILQENNITTLNEALVCNELWNTDNGITYCKKCHDKHPKKKEEKWI